MKLTRDTLLQAFAALVLLAGGAWLVQRTEWVDEAVTAPARGEAARDRHYALKQVMRRIGVEVVAPDNLDRLPPAGATLLLSSWQWNMFPEREQRLRRWVEGGGHLVVDIHRKPGWVPVAEVERRAASSAASAAILRAERRRQGPVPAERCPEWREPDSVAPFFGQRRSFRLCRFEGGHLSTTAAVRWSLGDANGPQALRIDMGGGSVTVSRGHTTDNDRLLDHDNALLLVALTQAAPGRTLWVVDHESRPPLLSVIWNAAAPAVLLFAAALALLLWRAGVRFGPRTRMPPAARRSVADQIRGTAAFVFSRDAATLHRVQLRALEEAARRKLRDHDRLDRRARAEAIARLTALDADALARAMDPSLPRARRDLVAALALLESAIRRLATER